MARSKSDCRSTIPGNLSLSFSIRNGPLDWGARGGRRMASIPEESNPGRPPAKMMPMPIIFSGEKKDLEECLGFTKRKRPNAPIAANHADTLRNVRGTRGGEIFNSLLQNLWILGRVAVAFRASVSRKRQISEAGARLHKRVDRRWIVLYVPFEPSRERSRQLQDNRHIKIPL